VSGATDLTILLSNFALIFSITIGLSLPGWFVIAPFAGSRPFLSLTAPWAGLIVISFLSLFYYVMLKVPMLQAATLAVGSCLLLSVTLFWMSDTSSFSRRGAVQWILAVACLSLVETLINTYMWGQLGGPALFFYDGTDHAGWAWTADWLRYCTVTQRPQDPLTSGLDAYQWMPYWHFTWDPRFGTFAALSLTSTLSGLPGLYSYDLLCALGLVVGILGIVGVFCRTAFLAIVLSIGLITCHCFDYGKTGYLGKLIDYPSIFIVVGLAFLTFRMPSAKRGFTLAVMTLLVIAVSHMYAGPLLGLFVGLLGAVFVVGNFLSECAGAPDVADRRKLLLRSRDELIFLALAVLLAVTASGIIARPLALVYSHYDLTWSYVFARDTDMENQGVRLTHFTDAHLLELTWVMGGLWIIGLVVALRARCTEAVALIAGPMLLLCALYTVDAQAVAFQLIGTFYPLALIALVVICDRLKTTMAASSGHQGFGLAALVSILLFAIGLHLPRFIGALERFEGHDTPPKYQFVKTELDGLQAVIGSTPTMIDVTEAPQFPLALIVALGHQVKFQWSERAWIFFSGCQPDVDPCSHRPPDLRPTGYRIVEADKSIPPDQIAFRTRQFLLIKERSTHD
jgi:hypothetical protein